MTQETDENERIKYTYTDKIGRVVMVKQQLANTPTIEDDHWSRSYTVYDDFGRVAAVIPPEAAKKMRTSVMDLVTSYILMFVQGPISQALQMPECPNLALVSQM